MYTFRPASWCSCASFRTGGYMRGGTPASTLGPRRSRSRTRVPLSDAEIRSRSAWVTSSLDPRRRNLTFAQASATSCRLDSRPALNAARPNWKADEPCIRVRSRSKNAAVPASAMAASAAIHLDDHRIALAAARADRGAPETAAPPAQLVHERPEDPCPRGADRVPERDGPAIDVDPVGIDAEHPDRVQGDRRERLVDLPQLDVLGLEPSLLERLPGGLAGRPSQVREVVGDLRLGDDRRERGSVVALGPLVAREDERAASVVDARGISGGVRAVLDERGRQLREHLERGVAARSLVDLDDGVGLLALDGDR